MTLQIKAEVLLNNSNWEKNLKKTSKQMEGFGKSMKTVANGVKAAWAGVALLAFGAVGDAIKDVTKAAAEDAKSQALLNKQMDNSWHATKQTKAEIDKYIDSMSNMSAIADDSLRPAFSKIVTVTKSASKAQKAFSNVLDISAGTGKDVNTVAQAYSKYLGGNKNALDKLVPGLKDAGDKMKFLQEKYGGMAAVAGNNDPFARITVVMDNFKEKLGTAFLPVVQKFSDWLASPDAQKSLDEIARKVQKFGEWFASPEGQKAFQGWMKDLKSMIKLAGQFLELVGQVADLIKSNDPNQNKGAKNKFNQVAFTSGPKFGELTPAAQAGVLGRTGNMGSVPPTVKMNITVNGVASGKDVVTELSKLARSKGVPLSKLLG